jgi:hypothetical protein
MLRPWLVGYNYMPFQLFSFSGDNTVMVLANTNTYAHFYEWYE